MLKKVLIGAAVVVAILAAGLFYLNNRNRTMSPPGSAQLTSGDLSVSISYSRPSVRGRLIFGSKDAGALQPYGNYWRLGANESTEITVNKDINFNGLPVKAGTYKMYAIPGPETFDIILNSELGKWGYAEADHDLDILKTTVPIQKGPAVELFTISLAPVENGIAARFEWSDVKFEIPVTLP